MAHARHPFSPSMRGPHLPDLKAFPLKYFFDYDRFFHSPWTHAFPPVNVTENDKSFGIDLIVPGLQKKDFNIFVDDMLLVVSTENVNSDKVAPSSFYRSFHLPPNVNEEDIQARYEAGVLKLTIPKKAVEVKAKKSIEVR